MVILLEIIIFKDIYYFHLTHKNKLHWKQYCKAKITLIKNKHLKNLKLSNKIILIDKADPGYDFYFLIIF